MSNHASRSVRGSILVLLAAFVFLPTAYAQREMEQGHSIGKVSIDGDLIVLELNDGALGQTNLFNLTGRTLRFTPDGPRYRVENQALQWDSDFGPASTSGEVTLRRFTFPFSNQHWNAFFVDTTGSISFGNKETTDNPNSGGRSGRGVSIGRFDPLSEAASRLIDSAPAICVFLKPRMSGSRYVKELKDRVVVTWDLTEPFGNIQDFTWFKTINRFQVVLYEDGQIDMSYKELAAKDAIVGIYPVLCGAEKPLAALSAEAHPDLAAHLDVRSVRLSTQDNILLKVAFQTRGPVIAEGDARLNGITYSIYLDQFAKKHNNSGPTLVWTVRGVAWRGNTPRYIAFGPGVSRKVNVSGTTIAIQGVLPAAFRGVKRVTAYAEVGSPGTSTGPVERIPRQVVNLSEVHNPEVHLSSLTRKSGSYAMAYESFHYLALPRDRDLACSVIQSLGDKFDFLAYYSDFRIDNQEAGTPSNGPVGGNVTGIGQTQHDLESYCTQGRFQWQFVQPVYVGSNQMQKEPPANAPVGSDRDITFYTRTAEKDFGHKLPPYNYAMSQLGHEMGHRWAAFVRAQVKGKEIVLGPVHWARGLQAPVKFPYQRPTEASIMGGGVWQENPDGTYTQLDDDYYVPATGYSYLDLYLMGLISAGDVPDFFTLKNLESVGKDSKGHPMFKAEKTKITIQDVIAAEGPRLPDVEHSQRKFNTGIVVVVEHGKTPSPELIQRANDIRQQWSKYWDTTTGHLSSMTANPR
jgi:hypothetical protein